MLVTAIVLSAVLTAAIILLLSYWAFLVYKSFAVLGEIMSVERKLATMPKDIEEHTASCKPTKKSSRSSKTLKSLKSSTKKKMATSKSTPSSERDRAGEENKKNELKELAPLEIRGPHPKVDRSPDREQFTYMVEKTAKFVKQYMENPEQYPVSADSLPGFLYQRLDSHPPVKPVAFDVVLNDFKKLVIPWMTHYKHPRYLASHVLTRSVPDIVGEVMAVQIGSPGFIYDASPAVAEMQVAMLNWAGRALGIPKRFLFHANSETSQGGASFQESIGDSTLCALMVARVHSTNQQFLMAGRITSEEHYLFAEATSRNMREHHAIYGKLCVYASSEAHPTLDKQCRLAMLRLKTIQALAENGYGVTAKQLEKAIKKDLAMGRIPCCIVVTLGTEGVLANDQLAKIGRLGSKYACWVHVMAHNVSSFWLEPKFRPPPEDLHYANSIMAQLPYHSNNMVVVWTRNQNLWKDGFKIFAHYLKPSKNYAIDERDWTIHLNRRFRGIKVWLNYRLIGLRRMREHVNQLCQLTAYLEAKLLANENIRMFGCRVLNSFCFTYYEKGLSPAELAKGTRLLGVFINESHKLFLKITNVAGNMVLAVSISYENTTQQSLDELYNDLEELILIFKQNRTDPTIFKFAPEASAPLSDCTLATARTISAVDLQQSVKELCK